MQRVLPSAPPPPDPRIEIIYPEVQNVQTVPVGTGTIINERIVGETISDPNEGAQNDFSGVFEERTPGKVLKSNSSVMSAENHILKEFDPDNLYCLQVKSFFLIIFSFTFYLLFVFLLNYSIFE